MRSSVAPWFAAAIAAGILLQSATAEAQSACPVASGPLMPGQLYLRSVDGRRWIEATAPEAAAVLTGSDRIRAIYAVGQDRGGVLAIKLRNEAPRTERDAQDVQEVHLERPSVTESCFAGRRPAFDRRVPAREYDDYHAAQYKESAVLHAFHFRYRSTERPECHRTDDGSIAGRTHYLFTVPGGTGEPPYRAAAVDGSSTSPLFTLFRDVVAAATGLTPAQAQAPAATAGTRYVYLRTMLRRYAPVAEGKPNCVAFSFDAAPNVKTTYVTVADLDGGQQSLIPQKTWALRWARAEK